MTYSKEVFVTLWAELAKLVKEGRLIAPREVLKEIEKQDDELLKWVKGQKKMFRDLDEEQLQLVRDILQNFRGLVDEAKETPEADPFVVALAITEHRKRQDSLFRGRCTVVTQEKPSRGGKPKIPDACGHYGIECVPVSEPFQREGWKF
jgi:hypothetical protein